MSDWLERGWRHVWLPYAQMQTAPLPLPAVRTEGARIHLADGRVLIDGVASWWTACHGYGTVQNLGVWALLAGYRLAGR